MVEDAARGWRRVVPSPEPLEILEETSIRALIDTGALVIAVGGGGIPVMRSGTRLQGCGGGHRQGPGVGAARSRGSVSALFIISTDADRVYLNYKKPDQRPLDRATADEMAGYYDAGQFPPGNMGPKIRIRVAVPARRRP